MDAGPVRRRALVPAVIGASFLVLAACSSAPVVSREDVDAATLTAGGNLLFSTLGNFSVTGVSGADEDVAEFVGSFGTATSGSSSMRLDLSTLGISANEDIGSLHIVE